MLAEACQVGSHGNSTIRALKHNAFITFCERFIKSLREVGWNDGVLVVSGSLSKPLQPAFVACGRAVLVWGSWLFEQRAFIVY